MSQRSRSNSAFFSWRKAILKSTLQPTTRHVLLTLACHMNEAGEECYPSIELLCKETGLSNRAVITHLQKAAKTGWIEVKKHGFAGQRWANNEYKMSWPEPSKVVNQVHDLLEEVVNVVPKGSERSDKKVVNEVHTSTSYSTSMSTPIKPLVSNSTDMRCPVEKIVALYHECMPNNPRVLKLDAGRKASIKARWEECAKGIGGLFGYQTVEDGLRHWRKFFEICATSEFLTGHVAPSAGRKRFIADIDFLFRESSFTNIIENKYHRDGA